MSQVLDTKVVEMRFDNAEFEKNVEVSLNSLKNLNKSVEDAGKGRNSLDDLARAGDQVGLAFDNMNMKSKISLNMMDLLAGVGTKAFNKISDAVANFALNMANSLSGMQAMRDGFAEYELKMGSVQTILAGAKIERNGKALTDEAERLEVVNQKLEELNAYSDRTIYSFKDMTSNIGKFTNAGVNLDDAVNAIQGVANVAALSGANANEASRAMYNFSQALSAGYVKLIDWKSIENANMATVGFKEELIKTALELGTIRKEGDAFVSTTMDMNGKVSDAFTATRNFNDSLAHQWMTTDVLTKTLAKYTDETTELGQKAFAAATEVKTFSQMIDTLKESLGSQWAQTFEILLGDFREARSLWTSINNVLDPLLTTSGKVRNAILNIWKDNGGREAMLNAFRNLYQAIVNLLSPLKAVWKALTPTTSHTGQILAAISKGFEKLTAIVAKGAAVIGKALATLLKPVVFIGNLVSKGLIKLVGIVRSAFNTISNVIKPVKEAINTFTETIYNAFNNATISRIKKFRDTLVDTFGRITKQIKANSSVQNLISAFKKLKEILQDLFSNILQRAGIAAERFVGYIGRLWKAIAPLVSNVVIKTLKTLGELILPKLEKAISFVANRLRDLGNLIGKIDIRNSKLYKGLASLPEKIKALGNNKVLKSLATKIKNFGSEAVEFLANKFKNLKANLDSIKMPRGLSDVFTNIKDFIKSIFGSDSIIDKADETAKALGSMGDEKSGQKLTGFQQFLKGISEAFDWLKNAATNAKNALKNFVDFVITNTPKALKSMYNFIAGDDGILTMSDVTDVIYSISDALSMLMSSFGIMEGGRAVKGISDAFGQLSEAVTTLVKRTSNRLQMAAIKDFAIAVAVLAGALFLLAQVPAGKLIVASVALVAVGKALTQFFNLLSTGTFNVAKIAGNLSIALLLTSIGVAMMGIAASIGMLVGALAIFPKVIKQYNKLDKEFATGMERVKEVLANIFSYLDDLATTKFGIRGALALLGLVKALDWMQKTIVKYANKKTGKAMEEGLNRIKEVLGVLGDFLGGATLASFNGINIGINLNTVGMAAMLWALGDMIDKITGPIKKFGNLTPGEYEQGFEALKKILTYFAIFLSFMSTVSKVNSTGMMAWLSMGAMVGMLASAIGSIVASLDKITGLVQKDEGSYKVALKSLRNIFIELGLLMAVIGRFKPQASLGTLFGLSAAIGILTACVIALVPIAKSEPKALLGAVVALGSVMLALGGALALTGKAGDAVSLGDIVKLIAMVLATLVLANTIRRLAKISKDGDSLVGAGLAISGAILAIAGAMKILGTIPMINPTVLLGLGLLAVAIWGVAAAITAFKSSAGGMSDASKEIEESGAQAGESLRNVASDSLSSVARDVIPQFINDLFGELGPRISAALANFNLGEHIRSMIQTLVADARNWAQDVIDLGTNLIEGIATALENPENIARLREAMIHLGQAIIEAFKAFFGINSPSTVMIEQGGFILDGLVQGLMEYPSKLAGWITGIGNFILEGIQSIVTGALEKGRELVTNLGAGIQNGKDAVVKKASELGTSALEKVGKVKDWAKRATESVTSYASRIGSGAKSAKDAAGRIASNVSGAIKGVTKEMRTQATNAASAFAAKLRSGANLAKSAAKSLVTAAKGAFSGIKSAFMTYGKNAAEGFKAGITSMISSIAQKAREMVRRAKDAAKAEQHSNSPSKDFMEYGGWAAQGYALGLVNRKSSSLIAANTKKMVDTAKGVVSANSLSGSLSMDSASAIDSLAAAMDQIINATNADISTNPSIRPVVDMNDVRQGSYAISEMLKDRQINAGVNLATAVKSDFEQVRQNNESITDSLNKLTNRIGSMTDSMNSRTLNVYNTIDGTSDPMEFGNQLIHTLRLNARTV